MSDITGSLTSKAETSPSPDSDPRRAAEFYGERYRANPKDPDAALAYGQALRAPGQRGPGGPRLEKATLPPPRKKGRPPRHEIGRGRGRGRVWNSVVAG